MTTSGEVSPQEYADLMLNWAGRFMFRRIGYKLTITR